MRSGRGAKEAGVAFPINAPRRSVVSGAAVPRGARLGSPTALLLWVLVLGASLLLGPIPAAEAVSVLPHGVSDTDLSEAPTSELRSDPALSTEPDSYDLARIVKRALSHHLGVRVATLQSATAGHQAVQQRAALRPSLSVTAAPGWFEKPISELNQTTSIPGGGQMPPGQPQPTVSGQSHSVTFNGTVPLWRSPLQRAVADAANWQFARAEADADEAAAGAILQSIDAYFAVLRAEAALHIAELTLAEVELRLDEIADRVRAGTATNMDKLQIESERHGAEARLLQARGEVTAARMMLNSVLGFDLNVPLTLAPPDAGPGRPFAATVEVGDALRLASRTGDVRQAYADRRLAEAGAIISEEQAKPALRMFGTYKWPDVELTLGVDRHGYLGGSAAWSQTYLNEKRVSGDEPASWFAGVELTWNLFDGGKQRAEVEAARLQAEQARVYHEHVEQTARTEVLAAYVRWQAAAEAVQGVARGIEAAAEGLEVARRLAAAGAATQSAVLRAEIGLAPAQQGYVDALYGEAMAHAAYLHSAGELVPHWQRVLADRP